MAIFGQWRMHGFIRDFAGIELLGAIIMVECAARNEHHIGFRADELQRERNARRPGPTMQSVVRKVLPPRP